MANEEGSSTDVWLVEVDEGHLLVFFVFGKWDRRGEEVWRRMAQV